MILRKYFYSLALFILCAYVVFVSYIRFIENKDYIVEYEGSCLPEQESCFQACEDDSCQSLYFFKKVTKRANDVYKVCGPDITDCKAASECLLGDVHCKITYCDATKLGNGQVCDNIVVTESKL
jgi:hypothetical protein